MFLTEILFAVVTLSRLSAQTKFTCSNGEVLPQSYVNDDYCDCSDGSDEPRTSACPRGLFRCINDGFLAKFIPSSRVNDGVCDCCDASDEYATGTCSNVCWGLSEDAKERARKLNELEMNTHMGKTKWRMINESQFIKKSTLEKIKSWEIERLALMQSVEDARMAKESLEKRMGQGRGGKGSEATNRQTRKQSNILFKYLDANDDGKLQFDEFKHHKFFDVNLDGTITGEERNYFTYGNEVITQDFFLQYVWSRLEPIVKSFDSTGNSELKKLQQRLEKETEKSNLNENDELEHHYSYGWIPKGLGDEYNLVAWEHSVAVQKVQGLEKKMKDAKLFLAKDHGRDDEFAALDGDCFFFYDPHFTYKLCHFEKVVKIKTGSVEKTSLGIWKEWLAEGGDDHKVMLYEDGDKCRQGLRRSTRVVMICGPSNKIVAFKETSHCQSRIEFQTPVSCRQFFHDEL